MNILDNIGKKMADTYKSAAKASGELLEETKLRFSIMNEQGKMEDLYQVLGEKVFSSYEKGKSLGEEFDNECKEIQSLKESINSLKGRAKELRNIKVCPQCSLEMDLSSQYCPQCGFKMEATSPLPPKEIIE